MQETQRQAYLENLGLTPWVARRPLPGAAESRVLARPAEPEPAPVGEPVPSTPPELRGPATEKPQRESTNAAPVPRTAPAATADEAALRFTLHALATPTLLLVIQQADAEAPEPGRDEQRLLASLLRYLNARGAKPRPFAWPLPTAEADAESARASLTAFVQRLCADQGLSRVLWLLEPELAELLTGGERLKSAEWGGLQSLAVPGLREMLEDPVAHKRAAWQAMVQHGFTA